VSRHPAQVPILSGAPFSHIEARAHFVPRTVPAEFGGLLCLSRGYVSTRIWRPCPSTADFNQCYSKYIRSVRSKPHRRSTSPNFVQFSHHEQRHPQHDPLHSRPKHIPALRSKFLFGTAAPIRHRCKGLSFPGWSTCAAIELFSQLWDLNSVAFCCIWPFQASRSFETPVWHKLIQKARIHVGCVT